MATFTLRHFSSAESLQAVQAKYLMDLLDKHAAYFATRGVDFGSFNGHGPDYEAIAAVLMTPDEQTPSDVLLARYLEQIKPILGSGGLVGHAVLQDGVTRTYSLASAGARVMLSAGAAGLLTLAGYAAATPAASTSGGQSS